MTHFVCDVCTTARELTRFVARETLVERTDQPCEVCGATLTDDSEPSEDGEAIPWHAVDDETYEQHWPKVSFPLLA